MRLIDADALKEMICSHVYPVADYFNSKDYGMFWTGGIEKAIDEQPTIDAEPVKHGEWILWDGKYDSGYICSRCKRPAGVVEAAEIYKYCPFCGAKMQVRCK